MGNGLMCSGILHLTYGVCSVYAQIKRSAPLVADTFPDLTHLCMVVLATPATFAAIDGENGITRSAHLPLPADGSTITYERHP